MTESQQSPTNSEQDPQGPSLEQMVRDIEQFDRATPGHTLDFEFLLGTFEVSFGYPDPRLTASIQRGEAIQRGEEPPLTIEHMAVDISHYERHRREADPDQPIPSFEETYGYPDPRQTQPGPSDVPGPIEQ